MLEPKPQDSKNPFQKCDNEVAGISAHSTGWRLGVAIEAADHINRKWRILLRRATINDFPPEKPWKRQQYQKGSHRNMQRPRASQKRKYNDVDHIRDSEQSSKRIHEES
jgi:hypothetical protein